MPTATGFMKAAMKKLSIFESRNKVPASLKLLNMTVFEQPLAFLRARAIDLRRHLRETLAPIHDAQEHIDDGIREQVGADRIAQGQCAGGGQRRVPDQFAERQHRDRSHAEAVQHVRGQGELQYLHLEMQQYQQAKDRKLGAIGSEIEVRRNRIPNQQHDAEHEQIGHEPERGDAVHQPCRRHAVAVAQILGLKTPQCLLESQRSCGAD